MILAKGNFKSSEKIDRICGYYLNGLLFLTTIYVVVAIFFGKYFGMTASLGLLLTIFCFGFSFYTMPVKERNNQHIGTYKWLLVKANGNRNKMTEESLNNSIGNFFIFYLISGLCLGYYTLFFMNPLESLASNNTGQSSLLFTFNEKISFFVLFVGYCLMVSSTVALITLQRNVVLSEQDILLIDEVEDFDTEFKTALKDNIIKIIKQKGFVTRHDFTEELKKIITKYESRKDVAKEAKLKENSISKLYPNLFKAEKNNDI